MLITHINPWLNLFNCFLCINKQLKHNKIKCWIARFNKSNKNNNYNNHNNKKNINDN